MDACELSMNIGYGWFLFETMASFKKEMWVVGTGNTLST